MKMTGGQVTIVEIKPYHTYRYTRAIEQKKPNNKEKSVVVARVTYGDNSMVDVETVYYVLQSIYRNTEAESNQVCGDRLLITFFTSVLQPLGTWTNV